MPTCAPHARGQPARAAARELLGEDRVVQVVAALPAVLLGVLQAEEADGREPGEDLVGEPARLLPLRRVGAQLVGDEAPDRLAQRLVLVGEGRVGGHRRSDRIARPRRARHRERDGQHRRAGLPGPRRLRPALAALPGGPVRGPGRAAGRRGAGLLRAGDRLLRRHPLRGHRGDLPRPRDVLGRRRAAAARRAERGGRQGPARRRPPPGAVDGQPRPARAHARAPPHGARVHAAARGRDDRHHPRHRRATCSTRSTRARRSTSSRR